MDREKAPLFYAKLSDLERTAGIRSVPVFTAFLTPEEQAQASEFFQSFKGLEFFGGFDGAERRMLGILPDADQAQAMENLFPLKAMEIRGSTFERFGHRDVLGSILALGVKREMVGDILADGACARTIVHSSVFPLVRQELKRVARDTVTCREIPLSELQGAGPKFELQSGTVSSLRLDAILALALKCSREKVERLIREGLVQVNHVLSREKDKVLTEGDVCSIRGIGKLKLAEVAGLTKKGRISVKLYRYL